MALTKSNVECGDDGDSKISHPGERHISFRITAANKYCMQGPKPRLTCPVTKSSLSRLVRQDFIV